VRLRLGLLALFVICLWALALVFTLPLWLPALGTLLVALGLVGAWWLARRKAERASRVLEDALASQADALEKRTRPDRQPALRALSAQFQQALATLRSSKLAHGRGGALYALPWYVIIGPPGTGKSTAIRESGLSFPLAGGQDAVRGVGGTRHCDWWLTNEAVLLDTAGRYATAEDDREEWLAFLDLLRRARPRRPLNGLIVALSASELAALDASALAELSAQVRARIDEVMGRLELRLPVYVLLTKCDLLPGFIDSFDDLRRAERGQVLGFTLPVAEPAELAGLLERHWMRLVQTLERRAVLKLSEVGGPQARHGVYTFPQQLEQLAPLLSGFLVDTFADNVYRDAPILRGVYLSSGTQEGNPIDRLTAAMASQFGLPAPSSETGRADRKSYFLTELFRGVMFADGALAGRGSAALARSARVRLLAAVGAFAFALMFAFASARAFAANRQLLREAQHELALAQTPAPEQGALAALAPLRARLASLQDAQRAGGTARELGLDQRPSLLPQLRAAYTSALRGAVIQPLVVQLEQQLSARGEGRRTGAPSAPAQASLFEHTKAYLLLTQPKAAGEPALDAAGAGWLREQLLALWTRGQSEPVSSAQRSELATHIGFYLDLLTSDPLLGFTRAAEPVRIARAELGRVPPVSLAIDRLVAALEPMGLELGLADLAGATGLPWHARGQVRGAFTRRGWESYARAWLQDTAPDLVGEAWVVERQQAGPDQARSCALRAAYFARYLEEWRTFLADLQMEQPLDQARALAMLQDLTRGQPAPIERLMRTVADNARLAPEAPLDDAQAEGVLDQLRKRVSESRVGKLVARPEPCPGQLNEDSVRRGLEGFYGFGASSEPPPPSAPAPVTSAQIYQEQLVYLRDALQAASDDPVQGEALLSRTASARTRVRGLIEAQPIGWRPRFEALLWPAVEGSSASAASALAGEQARGWCNTVVLPYAHTLRDRYPFSRRGQDAALADLADFYRPGTGTLWAFYGAALRRDLPQVGAVFEPRAGAGVGAHYSPELVRFLNRAQALSSALFPPRAEQPLVELELRVRPAPGIAQVLLTIDGQVVDFHNGPERWVRVSWPGTSDRRGASLRVRGDGIDETVVQEGEWGLFRLLEQSTISAQPGERFFNARWRLHTQHDVLVDVRPARAENPLVGERGFLDVFRGAGVEVPRALVNQARACRE
jgi:type VI secretion system protein ImpL